MHSKFSARTLLSFSNALALVFAGVIGLFAAAASAADVTSTWSAATSGNWNVDANWTNVPALGGFPNNGNGGVATYDAVISPVGAPYTVTLNTSVTVEDLLLNSANATLSHTSGTFTATGAITLAAGTYQLDGGTISNTAVNVTGATLAIAANGSNLLTGVAVNGDLTLNTGNARTKLAGSTTFNTAHLAESQATLGIAPGYVLSGAILFEGASSSGRAVVMDTTPGTFTVGPTGVMRTEAGFGGNVQIGGQFIFFGAMSLVNQGLISSQTSGRTVTVIPDTLTSSGTLSATGGGILTIQPTNSWTNSGTISLNNGTLNLGGTFNAAAGIGTWSNTAGTVNITGTINNAGSTLTLNNSTGSWTLNGGTISGGTLDFAAGKTLAFAGNGSNLLSGVTVNGDLNLNTNNARTKLAGGTMFNTAHLAEFNTGLGFAPGETLTSTVLFEGAAGGIRAIEMNGTSGTFTVGPTGVIRTVVGLGGNVFFGSGSLFSGGTMTLVNQGLISSQTSGRTVNFNSNANFTNSGTVEAINGTTLVVPLGYTQTAGTTRLSGTISALNGAATNTITIGGGRLEGSGTIMANVANSGTIEISPSVSGGILTITGDLTLNSSSALQVDIGGNIQGANYDFLSEAGNTALNLAGALNVTLTGGFVPAAADSLIILSSNQPITGAFSNVVAGHILASDGLTSLRLAVIGNHVVISGLSGDYNHNGIVDAADYVVWRHTLGQSGTSLVADGNHNNQVDAGDYNVWRANFGATVSTGSGSSGAMTPHAAVPEPASLLLALFSSLAASLIGPRYRQDSRPPLLTPN